ncbi:MFS transporter [Lederbergia lenta]|uniref:MFS transporter n=1 Tax=Lederbergia lenta TaxID=1467 RepID=UPI00203EC41B|nr:MFS transporter [Lederbergia lenta]MCM3111785.1 MFS transporter [Lederbergia lenta]
MEKDINGKKSVIIIALITAVSVLGNEMLFIVMPIYWKFFGLTSIWQIGVLLSANRIIRLPINSLVGLCYEKMSKRSGLLLAVILAVISTFSYGVFKGFGVLLAMRILWGIAWSFLRLGGYLTVISSSDQKTRGHFIGLYNGLWGLGTLFGMLIGGIFTEIIGIRTITTIFAILGICSIPFVIRYVPNKTADEGMEKKKTQPSVNVNRKQLLSVLLSGLLVAFVVYGIFTSTLSKVIEHQIGDSLVFLTYTVGAVAIAGVLQSFRMGLDPFLAPLIGKLSDQKFGRVPILIFALSLGTICLFIIPINTPFIAFLFIILVFQLVSTLLITTSDSMAADLSSDYSSVKTMTHYTLFVDFGSALGPLISYFVIDFIGLHWLYWSTGIIMIFLIVFWSKEFQQQRKKNFAH